MIPTLMRHEPTCVNPKPVRDAVSFGVVVWKCLSCGAIASTPESA